MKDVMHYLKHQIIFAILLSSGFIPMAMATGAVVCASGQACTDKQMQMKMDKAQQGAQDAMALAGNTTIWMSDSTGSSCYQIQNNTANMLWIPNLNSTVSNASSDFTKLAANDKTCSGSPICVQSVNPSNCGTPPPPAQISGSCGTASGAAFADASALNSAQLCGSGSASAISGSGPWSWSCLGANGGSDANGCNASLAGNDGVCGPADGQYFDDIGSVTIAGLCNAGTATPVGMKPNGKPWGWNCKGKNGGKDAACTAIPGKTHGCQCFCTASDGSHNYFPAGSVPDTNGACDDNQCNCTGNSEIVYFACGAANGKTYSNVNATTSAGLCSGGTAVTVAPSGNGPWSWVCKVSFLPTAAGRQVSCGAKQGP